MNRPVCGVVLVLCSLFAIATARTDDFGVSPAPVKREIGDSQAINNISFPHCEQQPLTYYPCCDMHIKEIILSTLREPEDLRDNKRRYEKCNIHNMASKLQMKAEMQLNHPYEAIVAPTQFENEAHILDDMMCKLKVEDLNILLYAVDKRSPAAAPTQGCVAPTTTTTTEAPKGCATEPTTTPTTTTTTTSTTTTTTTTPTTTTTTTTPTTTTTEARGCVPETPPPATTTTTTTAATTTTQPPQKGCAPETPPPVVAETPPPIVETPPPVVAETTVSYGNKK